jgi:hypothetical protein
VRPAWRSWALLALVAIVARAATFGNPNVHVDEDFYFVFARAMIDGAVAYVDIWDRKPIGLMLVYAPAAMAGVGAGVLIYQAMALAAAVSTALMIHNLAHRAGSEVGAIIAAIAYLLWLNLLEGQGGQAPVFYNALMAGAALVIVAGDGFRRGLVAMALVGLALQIKYSAVFEGAFFGLWLIWRDWRAGRSLKKTSLRGLGWATAALLPTALAYAVFAGAGHGAAFVYANFTSILDRQPDPMAEQLGNLAKIVLITSPLLAMAALGWRGGRNAVASFLYAWLAAALAGLLVFGSWFDHYALPLLVPAACCAARFAGQRWRVAIGVLAVVLIGGQATIIAKRVTRGGPDQFAALVSAIGRGPGCLYVYSGPSLLYPASARCAPTAYRFPSHLGRSRERGAIGVDQAAEIRRILAGRPEVVVMRPVYRGERPEVRTLVLGSLARTHRLAARLPLGNERISIYRAAAGADGTASRSSISPE